MAADLFWKRFFSKSCITSRHFTFVDVSHCLDKPTAYNASFCFCEKVMHLKGQCLCNSFLIYLSKVLQP